VHGKKEEEEGEEEKVRNINTYIAWRNAKLLDVTSGGRKLTPSFKRGKKEV
jgi:hypothetical protein